jgi:hypothetical protein
MLDSVILTRGQVWMSPEIRELVGLEADDDEMGFAIFLDEASQVLEEKEESLQIARCA